MPHFDYNSADRDILGFLHDVADAAADTLDEIADWSMSGEREGQYSADVVIDDVIVDLLQASGFEVLSEEIKNFSVYATLTNPNQAQLFSMMLL